MEEYIGSQQHWEDNINSDYDEHDRHNRDHVDNRTQPDPREQPNPIDVSNDLGYYLNNATDKEKRLIGVLMPDGSKRSFIEYCSYNELNDKILLSFETIEELFEWEDS